MKIEHVHDFQTFETLKVFITFWPTEHVHNFLTICKINMFKIVITWPSEHWTKLLVHVSLYLLQTKNLPGKYLIFSRISKPIFINFLTNTIIMKMLFFLKMKYDLSSNKTTLMIWRGCVAFLILDFQILR